MYSQELLWAQFYRELEDLEMLSGKAHSTRKKLILDRYRFCTVSGTCFQLDPVNTRLTAIQFCTIEEAPFNDSD